VCESERVCVVCVRDRESMRYGSRMLKSVCIGTQRKYVSEKECVYCVCVRERVVEVRVAEVDERL